MYLFWGMKEGWVLGLYSSSNTGPWLYTVQGGATDSPEVNPPHSVSVEHSRLKSHLNYKPPIPVTHKLRPVIHFHIHRLVDILLPKQAEINNHKHSIRITKAAELHWWYSVDGIWWVIDWVDALLRHWHVASADEGSGFRRRLHKQLK